MADIGSILNALAYEYGYLGVLFASLLGSVVPFLPVPYLIIVVVLSGRLDPLLLGVAAGLGGALGKASSYFLGRAGYSLTGGGTRKNLDFLGRFVGKYGALGVFLFAVTPLPDDIYLVPLGMLKFPFWRFMAANTLGKILLSVAVAYLGRAYFELAGFYLGGNGLATTVGIVAFTVLVTLLLARTDWQKAHTIYGSRGAMGVVTSLGEILSGGGDDEKPED